MTALQVVELVTLKQFAKNPLFLMRLQIDQLL